MDEQSMDEENESLEQIAQRQSEILVDKLYDYERLSDAKEQWFFQRPLGIGGKTEQDTNLYLSATLPSGVSFVVRSIELTYIPDSLSKDDYIAAAPLGFVQLQILHKSYVRFAPIGCFMRPWVRTLEREKATETEAAPWTYGPFDTAATPLTLLGGNQFAVSVRWTSESQRDRPRRGRIGVVLHGVRQRPVC